MKYLLWLLCLCAFLLIGCSEAPPIPKGESPQHPLGMAGMLGKPEGAKAYADRMQATHR